MSSMTDCPCDEDVVCDIHRADTERDAFIAGVQEGAKAAEARIVAWLDALDENDWTAAKIYARLIERGEHRG